MHQAGARQVEGSTALRGIARSRGQLEIRVCCHQHCHHDLTELFRSGKPLANSSWNNYLAQDS
jgi:hypothetical protein